MRRALAAFAAACSLLVVAPSCGGGDGPPPVAAKREAKPSWQDVFDVLPELYVVVRPQALKRDQVYGSLWKAVVRVAEAKRIVTSQSTLEAAEGAEEIIAGVNPGFDAALVLRGVPASIDPQQVKDERGQPMFRLVDERARIPEYQVVDRRLSADGGSLFVLPDRTWVGVVGEARHRARTAFATPFGRPEPTVDRDALGVVRLGEGFVQQPRYVKSPVWGPLTKKLTSVTLALKPAKGGLVVTFQYNEEGQTAFAEMQLKQLIEELARDERRFGWLKDAKVAYEGKAVVVRMPLPARLLEELPNASPADIPL